MTAQRHCVGLPYASFDRPAAMSETATTPACPVCTGDMWDNTQNRTNPRTPLYKCRRDGKNGTDLCAGVIWPPREKGPTADKPCPKCAGPMEDCRAGSTNPKAPAYRCMKGRDECDGAIWLAAAGEAACPVCAGRMWDNRGPEKKNQKAPNFKCRDKACTGVIWPPRDGEVDPYPMSGATTAAAPARAVAGAPVRTAPRPAAAPMPMEEALLSNESLPF